MIGNLPYSLPIFRHPLRFDDINELLDKIRQQAILANASKNKPKT